MMEMFNLMIGKGLNPNQFYLLYCIRKNTGSLTINIHQELRSLEKNGWIKKMEEGDKTPILEPKAITLIQQVESFFITHKKKTATQVMGKGYGDNLRAYRDTFPKKKLPSGEPARNDLRNLEIAMKWFFENHEYSWETILKATDVYVTKYEKVDYLYMRTSVYFIRKEVGKDWNSTLANYCAAIDNGDDLDDIPENAFGEKVV